MSKSDPSDDSRINLTDDADAIAQKMRKARTDPEPLPETLEDLKAAARGRRTWSASMRRWPAGPRQEVLAEFGGQGFGAFKPALADLAVAEAGPGGRRDAPSAWPIPPRSTAILEDGAARAREIAAPTMAEVKKIVGYWAG